MNIKRIAAFLLAAAMMLSLCGCNIIQVDAERDRAQVVAVVGEEEILKGEVLDLYDTYKSMYGISQDIEQNPTSEEAEMISSLKEQLLDSLIEQKLIALKVKDGGFDNYTEEQIKDAEESVDQSIESYLESAREVAKELGEDPETYAQNALEELFRENNLSREQLIQEQLTVEIGQENLREYNVKDVAASDEEIADEYDSLLTKQKENYDSKPLGYESDYANGLPIVYAPANYAFYKHLLVEFAEDDKAAITEAKKAVTDAQKALNEVKEEIETLEGALDEAEDKEAAQSDIDELKAEKTGLEVKLTEAETAYDDAFKAGLANIQEEADALLARVEAGEDFDKLIQECGDDKGMTDEPAATTGYPIPDKGDSVMVPEFTSAAQALKNIGDHSGLVSSSYGYSIIMKAGLVTAGEVPLDNVREAIAADITVNKQNTAWTDLQAKWIEDAKADKTIIIYLNRL